jgi:hypothetical protein
VRVGDERSERGGIAGAESIDGVVDASLLGLSMADTARLSGLDLGPA